MFSPKCKFCFLIHLLFILQRKKAKMYCYSSVNKIKESNREQCKLQSEGAVLQQLLLPPAFPASMSTRSFERRRERDFHCKCKAICCPLLILLSPSSSQNTLLLLLLLLILLEQGPLNLLVHQMPKLCFPSLCVTPNQSLAHFLHKLQRERERLHFYLI